MKYQYRTEPLGKLKMNLKEFAIAYAIIGTMFIDYNNKTGHQSADLATGRSQPTQLETKFLNLFDISPIEIETNKDN